MESVKEFERCLQEPLDRSFIDSEGWPQFLVLMDKIDIHDRFKLESVWARALFNISMSPLSGERNLTPDKYHLKLVSLFGKQGFRLLRKHRQQEFVIVPWLESGFLELGRAWFFRYPFSKERYDKVDLDSVDYFWSKMLAGTISRQLITVFARDWRTEQQRNFNGIESLERAFSFGIEEEVLFENISEPFGGRERLLRDMSLRLKSVRQKDASLAARKTSCWFLLFGEAFYDNYSEEIDLAEMLTETFWLEFESGE